MRKSAIIALLMAIVIATSCATTKSIPDRLDEFVEKTEREYKNYSEEDWKKSREEYDALVAEMKENYESLSISEKVQAAKAVGRYSSILLSNEISEASGTLGNILEKIPETVNGVIDQIDTAAIRRSFEGLVNSVDTARLRKQIEGLTENIDTARLREKLEGILKIFGKE